MTKLQWECGSDIWNIYWISGRGAHTKKNIPSNLLLYIIPVHENTIFTTTTNTICWALIWWIGILVVLRQSFDKKIRQHKQSKSKQTKNIFFSVFNYISILTIYLQDRWGESHKNKTKIFKHQQVQQDHRSSAFYSSNNHKWLHYQILSKKL